MLALPKAAFALKHRSGSGSLRLISLITDFISDCGMRGSVPNGGSLREPVRRSADRRPGKGGDGPAEPVGISHMRIIFAFHIANVLL